MARIGWVHQRANSSSGGLRPSVEDLEGTGTCLHLAERIGDRGSTRRSIEFLEGVGVGDRPRASLRPGPCCRSPRPCRSQQSRRSAKPITGTPPAAPHHAGQCLIDRGRPLSGRSPVEPRQFLFAVPDWLELDLRLQRLDLLPGAYGTVGSRRRRWPRRGRTGAGAGALLLWRGWIRQRSRKEPTLARTSRVWEIASRWRISQIGGRSMAPPLRAPMEPRRTRRDATWLSLNVERES